MNKFYTLILSVLTFSLGINAQITELFFSEYAEGSSNNKYLEIYNGTSSTISLDNYAFPSVSNAPTTPGQYEYWNTFPANASIAAGDVYVIAHPSADASILAQADHTHSYLSNGDDGYALVKGGTHNDADGDGNIDAGEMTGFTLLDHIGNWGGDPGSGWDVAGVTNATVNHTLVRKASVTGPNACWDQSCGNGSAGTNATDSEWIVYPNNTWTYLGSHPHAVPSANYNVTLSVNTSSIIVGANGMYAGGGVLGDAMAVPLSDPDGDGTWTGVASITPGTSGNYIFLNSPNSGNDWSAKEDLNGLACSDPANYNDRILPNITADTTMLHCFGSCETDGTCPAPPSSSPAALVGTWKLSPVGGALAVGPNQGDGSWWSNPLSEVTNRACIFDDSIKLENNGNMTHYMDGSTWLESWQGVSSEQCGSPVAPHDGGSDTWSFSNNQLIVNGVGAHFGLPKAYNGGELDASATVPASRTYEVSFSTDSSQMYLDIASAGGGSGWWRFIYQKTSTSPPASYNVTLKVNTASITVGANGMYAGGGFLGGSDGLQLTDADGDGTWEGVATVPPGSSPNYYAFFNSPSHGSDWGTKENLGGTTCGISSNYDDRVLPTITSDTTMLHCFGSCETDGTCPAPPSVFFDVTFQVDASNITVGANGIYAGGGVLGDAMAYPLSDADGDGVWETTISLADGTSGNYIFLNSPTSGGDWGAKEDLTGLACSDPANYNDRILAAVTADITIPYCFGTCDATCPAPPPVPTCNYTIDMQDSYGDGWNGASVDVAVNGTVVANWGLASGFSGS